MIQIKCKTGYSLPLKDFRLYSGKLKKHSMLEIERIVDSIINDGFLFPITVGKVGDKNYIIDGEATYNALYELLDRGYQIPDIPVIYIECNENNIREIILIGTSTNHCVTKPSLEEFVKNTNIDLKKYAFNEGELIDFYKLEDLNIIFEPIKEKSKKYTDDLVRGLL